jgi:hypothetical protein
MSEIMIPADLGQTTHISNKPTIHLSHYNGEFVVTSPDDVKKLEDEFGPSGYGRPDTEDPSLRVFDMRGVIDLLDYYNIFLTED